MHLYSSTAALLVSLACTLCSPVRAAAPADCQHNRDVMSAERGTIFEYATGLIPGQYYWKLVDAAWCTDVLGGYKINIFYKCLNESGAMIANQACIANHGTTNETIYTKAPPDWGDFPMVGNNWCPSWPSGGHGPYSAWVSGAPSDTVRGMGLPCNYHESYYLTWQWTRYGSPTMGAISGTVTSTSGQPLAVATVTANPGSLTTQTQSNGSYALTDVPAGTYTVTVSKSGWSTEEQTGVQVSAGATTTLNVTLSSSLGSINGTVRDSTGVPLAYASVKIAPTGRSIVTDAMGSYVLESVPPDTYSVTAFAPTKMEQTASNQVLPAGGSLTVNFNLSGSGKVVHTLDDFNGPYVSSLESSFKYGIQNQFFWQETLEDRRLPPLTGTNSSQGFAVITNNDQFLSYFQTKDPWTSDFWFNLTRYVSEQGWEPIDLSVPLTYIVYAKGFNLASNPDDPSRYWRQRLSVHFPSTNYDNDTVDWNSSNNGTWQMLRVAAPGLRNGQEQWLSFESWYPPYYASMLNGTSWMVFENLLIEYKPQGADKTPPGPVENFSASGLPHGVQLTWQNPTDSDVEGTTIRYRNDAYPTSPQDGALVVDEPGGPGANESVVHVVPEDGQTYYYAAFAHDESANFATAVTASVARPFIAPGDFDRDNDVDMIDFAHLQMCLSGEGIAQREAGCADALLDSDDDVDQFDVGMFIDCLSGPGAVPEAGCGR